MTTAIALGGSSPHLGIRNGERGGKDVDDGGQRFSDALMKMPERPQRNDHGTHDRAADHRTAWKIGDLGKVRIGSADQIQVPTGEPATEVQMPAGTEADAPQEGDALLGLDDASGGDSGDAPQDETRSGADALAALLPQVDKPSTLSSSEAADGPDMAAQPNAAGEADPATIGDGDEAVRAGADVATEAKAKASVSPQSQFAALVQQAAGQRAASQRGADAGAPPVEGDGTETESGKPAARGGTDSAVPTVAASAAPKEPSAAASRQATAAQAMVNGRETNARNSDAAPAAGDTPRAGSSGAASGTLDTPAPRVSAAPDQAQSGPRDPVAGRVSVVSFQSAVAPAPVAAQVISPTGAGLVHSMASDSSWQAAARAAEVATSMSGANATAGTSSLRIQLQPLELGMVTAKLTSSGAQLSVEIQVESVEAHQRLSSDSDQIVKALRAVGLEIDRLTIQQAQPSNGSALSQGGGGRDQASPNPQAQGDGDARRQGDRGGNDQNGQGARHGAGDAAQDAGRGGVYI